MSHEIRTPMNAILGMAELLGETTLTLEQQDYVQRFKKAGEHLLMLINDVLDLSKIEAGHLELEHTPFDLDELMQTVGELMVGRATAQGLERLTEVAPDVPTSLIGDASRLRQLLINLAGNAIKFTHAGEISIRVENDPEKPQPGRLRFEERRIDLRISILPTQLGAKVVIHILDSNAALVNLDNLAFAATTRQAFERMLSNATGLILVTGPTGSGKSTTLYAALNRLKSPTKNIVTVENPIEFQIPGITQVQIDVKTGMTFATGLRSILRQDPDIILVGEIRDRETASIAIEASQTGHLLLSTLHTNDAPSTLTRLIDLGIEPFKITSSLTGVLAQRLVRRICATCAAAYEPPPKMLEQLGLTRTLPKGAQWNLGLLIILKNQSRKIFYSCGSKKLLR